MCDIHWCQLTLLWEHTQEWYPGCVAAVLLILFWGTSILISIVAIIVYILINSVRKGSFFSTPSPAFVIYFFFVDSHSGSSKMASQCSFDVPFSDGWVCWTFSHRFIGHVYFFWDSQCFTRYRIYLYFSWFAVRVYQGLLCSWRGKCLGSKSSCPLAYTWTCVYEWVITHDDQNECCRQDLVKPGMVRKTLSL
jgi:hypothetical protein